MGQRTSLYLFQTATCEIQTTQCIITNCLLYRFKTTTGIVLSVYHIRVAHHDDNDDDDCYNRVMEMMELLIPFMLPGQLSALDTAQSIRHFVTL